MESKDIDVSQKGSSSKLKPCLKQYGLILVQSLSVLAEFTKSKALSSFGVIMVPSTGLDLKKNFFLYLPKLSSEDRNQQ